MLKDPGVNEFKALLSLSESSASDLSTAILELGTVSKERQTAMQKH